MAVLYFPFVLLLPFVHIEIRSFFFFFFASCVSLLFFFLLEQSLRALSHALVHESEEADGAGADAHAVDEAAGEERAEDGAEVGVGDLCKKR